MFLCLFVYGTDLSRVFDVQLRLAQSESKVFEERVEKEKERAEKERERADKEKAEKEKYQLVAQQAVRSTEFALAHGEDEMSKAFDDAPVVDFWLSNESKMDWTGPWEKYASTDPSKGEVSTIQPAIVRDFAGPSADNRCAYERSGKSTAARCTHAPTQ